MRIIDQQSIEFPWERLYKAHFPDPISEPTDRKEMGLVCYAALIDATRQFAHLANEVGLYVPDDLSWVDPELDQASNESLYQHAHSQWHGAEIDHSEFEAFAQHYGIPTLLMDWTRKPLNAAFFAAEDDSSDAQRSEQISVWAIHVDRARSIGFRVLDCRRSDHRFIWAQDGAFIYWPFVPSQWRDHGRYLSFTEVLAEPHPIERIDAPVFVQLTLDRSEVPSLINILQRERISWAHLKPTYADVATHIKHLWCSGQLDWVRARIR